MVSAFEESLAPDGPVQQSLAAQIVGDFVRLARTDRLEAVIVAARSRPTPDELSEVGDPAAIQRRIDRLELLDASRGQITGGNGSGRLGLLSLLGVEPAEDVSWETLARSLRAESPKPEIGITDLWIDDLEPTSEEGWKTATETLYAHYWRDPEHLDLYLIGRLNALSEQLETVEGTLKSLSAERTLRAVTEIVERPRGVAWRRVQQALKAYREEQARDSEE
jgi:hypothetical protein